MSRPNGMPADAHDVYRRYLSAVVLHGQASANAVGLGATDLYAMNLLALGGSMTSGALARRTGLTTGATTRLIDRLEKTGHLRRVIDPADRRKIMVEPVGPGTEDVDTAVDPARREVGELFATYTEEQLATLFDYFARATEAYHRAITELRDDAPDRHIDARPDAQ
ncbi:MarR family winged helix-turn-helix transcriptional regulator [Microlunatus soli]|uniref:DNA-binding transcriptional regulator, MarR family n=1 Tax=Microlunatus soli TaxID=630515 RepID=A0A1H1V009_9ACTN|nr:MarR family transcriptional regulator [Microlunatus soli]SDS78112.1 DNA-binding transcriptional regulator, MarR family [Microlunatus soli]